MRPERARFLKWTSLLWTCCAIGLPVIAQTDGRRAQSVEQLQAELERRDAIIADLLQRVQALEQRVGSPPVPRPPTSTPPAARARGEVDEGADEALLERALERSLVLSGGALSSPVVRCSRGASARSSPRSRMATPSAPA